MGNPIAIDNDSGVTHTTSVTLHLAAFDTNGVAEMKFSNDNINYSIPEAYAASKAWTLTPGDGTKTVYARFKDNAGNWSSAYSDTIVLDAIPPSLHARSYRVR